MLSKIESRNISIIANRLNIDKKLVFELYDYDLLPIKKESILTNREVSLLKSKVLDGIKELNKYKDSYVDTNYIIKKLGILQNLDPILYKNVGITDIIYGLGLNYNLEVTPVKVLKSGLCIFEKELANNFIISTLTTVFVNTKTGEKRRIIREYDLSNYMGISNESVNKIIELGLLKEWSVYGNSINVPKVEWFADYSGVNSECEIEETILDFDLEDVHDLMKVPNLEEKILKDDIETILADLIDIEKDTMQNEVKVYVETPKKETKVVLNKTNELDIEDIKEEKNFIEEETYNYTTASKYLRISEKDFRDLVQYGFISPINRHVSNNNFEFRLNDLKEVSRNLHSNLEKVTDFKKNYAPVEFLSKKYGLKRDIIVSEIEKGNIRYGLTKHSGYSIYSIDDTLKVFNKTREDRILTESEIAKKLHLSESMLKEMYSFGLVDYTMTTTIKDLNNLDFNVQEKKDTLTQLKLLHLTARQIKTIYNIDELELDKLVESGIIKKTLIKRNTRPTQMYSKESVDKYIKNKLNK